MSELQVLSVFGLKDNRVCFGWMYILIYRYLNLISSFFGGIKIEGKIPLLNNTIRGNPEQISKVIEQLDLMNPN